MLRNAYAWMSSSSADHLGSFFGGLSTIFVAISLVVGFIKWKQDRQVELAKIAQNERDEEIRQARQLDQVAAQLVDKINLSSGMLLVERGKIWAEALQWTSNDRSSRYVLAKAAVRSTILAASNIESVIINAGEYGISKKLKTPLLEVVSAIEKAATEDIELIKYFHKKDEREQKHMMNDRNRLLSVANNEADYDRFRKEEIDNLAEVGFTSFHLAHLSTELGKRLAGLTLAWQNFDGR